MYKLNKNIDGGEIVNVQRLSDGAFIPFDPANMDYRQFKNDIRGLSKDLDGNLLEEAELQDADGNTMTAVEAKEYIATLP